MLVPLQKSKFGIETIPIEDSTLTDNPDSDYDEVLKHQKKYTKLLSVFVNTTRINLYIKILLKVLFFVVTIGIWLCMIKLFSISSKDVLNIIETTNDDEKYIKTTIDLLATFIPSLVSLITSFIVIPKIIAEYLFNVKEENSMVSIITSLQSYDDGLYKHRYNEELLAHQEYAANHPNIDEENKNPNTEDDTDDSNDERNQDNGNAG